LHPAGAALSSGQRMTGELLLVTHHRTFKARLPWRVEGVARTMRDAGWSVTIQCTADTSRTGVREFTEDGIRFVETPDLLHGRQRSGWDPWNALHRARWLRGRRFDLIHAFETRPAVIHPLLRHLRRSPTPLVLDWCDWWGRGGLITEQRPAWYRVLFGACETHYEERHRWRADATTVIARGLIPRARGLGVNGDSIFWVPNGCLPERHQPAAPAEHRAGFGLGLGDFVAGFTAADVHFGWREMLAGFEAAADREPRLRLLVTGRHPPALGHAVVASRHAARIRVTGFLPNDAYPRALACVDVFLLPFLDRPANHGRWPGRINDYLCAGRPVITQPVGEMAALLAAHPIGVLSEPDPDSLARALLGLAGDAERCRSYGRAARTLAEGPLHWRHLQATLSDAYACAARRWQARR
jgi:glycosyltransferase involved in cell wall biosynthesis